MCKNKTIDSNVHLPQNSGKNQHKIRKFAISMNYSHFHLINQLCHTVLDGMNYAMFAEVESCILIKYPNELN